MAQQWSVDGFTFNNEEDAKLARAELTRIEQLEEKIDHTNPHLVCAVYEKAIANKLFKTPVGLCYLKKLQDELNKSPLIQAKISEVPVDNIITKRKLDAEAKKLAKKENSNSLNAKHRFSIIVNVVLTLLIVVLFYITTTSNNPNIINYEYNLQNKYASWNEELTQREQAVREKEKELFNSEK